MRELFKLVWLDGFHCVARDMENDLTRRLTLLPSAVTGGVKWVKVMEDLLESIDHYFDMLNKGASGQVMKNAYSILEKSAQDSRQYIESEGQQE